MPADYLSTAQALALPISPPDSPRSTRRPISPPWRRSRSNSSRIPRPSAITTFRNDIQVAGLKLVRQGSRIYHKMVWWQRILAGLGLLVLAAIGVLLLIFNEKIFSWLDPIAVKWRHLKAGWLLSWLLIFICAFPPLIGYSTGVTIAGFLYGFPNGWFVAASSTIVGSLCSFVVSRTVLASYVERLSAKDKRFTALALTLKHDGLKLLCMIRLCPLPYSLSNGAMSTFQTVDLLKFGLATAISTPKLFIPVFIGSRLAEIAERGGKMSIGTKAINYAGIAFGLGIGLSVGWIIYRRTMLRARELENEERARSNQPIDDDDSYGPPTFTDDVDSDAADLDLNDDEIRLFEQNRLPEAYRDEYTDEDLFVGSGSSLPRETKSSEFVV